MAAYTNDLRLKEIATGDESGTWGDSTNTNLELIGDAFGYGTEAITTNADTHATTIADGSADAGRAMFLKYTGTLDSTCTVTIPTGMTSVIYSDGAGSGGAMIDALTDLNVASSLNIGGSGAATTGKAIAMALVFG